MYNLQSLSTTTLDKLRSVKYVKYLNYAKQSFFNGNHAIEEFHNKLSIISKNSSDDKTDSCTVLFSSQFTSFRWQHIDCTENLINNYFLCEIDMAMVNKKERIQYSRKPMFCLASHSYINGSCWNIQYFNKSHTVPSVEEFKTFTELLTYWSYGDDTKSKVLYYVGLSGHFCLMTNSFNKQLIKHWLSVPCVQSEVTFTLQESNSHLFHADKMCNMARNILCDNDTCLLNIYRCDGVADCNDESDEAMCSNVCSATNRECYRTCSAPLCYCEDIYFQCHFGGCIPMPRICDGVMNCNDGSDELNCYYYIWTLEILAYNNTQSMHTNVGCSHGGIQCDDSTTNVCHSSVQRCVYDTHNVYTAHCSTLEHLFHCDYFECPSMYKCNMAYCIPTYQLCDDVRDCPDGEDEQSCNKVNCPGLLRCKLDNICIHPLNICDGTIQCLHSGDDEQFCLLNSCPDQCKCQGQLIKCTSNVPMYFSEATAIKILLLDNVNIEHKLGIFKFLLHLTITKCKFKFNIIPTHLLNSLTLLRNLILSDCSIVTINTNIFSDLNSLQVINLQGNNIYALSIKLFSISNHLKFCDLSRNTIKTVPSCTFCGLLELQLLNLSGNSINYLKADGLEGLKSLRMLDLRNNPLAEVEVASMPVHKFTFLVDTDYHCCLVTDLRYCLSSNDFAVTDVTCVHMVTTNNLLSSCVKIIISFAIIFNILIAIDLTRSDMKSSQIVLQQHLLLTDTLFLLHLFGVTIVLTLYRYNAVFLNITWPRHTFCKFLGSLPAVAFILAKYELCLISFNQLLATKYSMKFTPLTSCNLIGCLCVGWIFAVTYIVIALREYGHSSVMCYLFVITNEVNALMIFNTIIYSLSTLLTLLIMFNYVSIVRYAIHTSRQVQSSKSNARIDFLIRYTSFIGVIEVINSIIMGMLLFYKSSLSYNVTMIAGLLHLGVMHSCSIFLKRLRKCECKKGR